MESFNDLAVVTRQGPRVLIKDSSMNAEPREPSASDRLNIVRRSIAGLTLFFVLLIVGYLVHEGRSPSPWGKLKQDLERRGEIFDVTAFVPPEIPDDSNILKAPIMEALMYRTPRKGNIRPLIRINATDTVHGDWHHGRPTGLLEWRAHFKGKPGAYGQERTMQSDIENSIMASQEVMPLILIHEAPLGDAIRNLARQADINKIGFDESALQKVHAVTNVTLRHTDYTAWNALQLLLGEHGLMLDFDLETRHLRVTERSPNACQILEDLNQFSEEINELHEACRRPDARWDFDYEDWERELPNFMAFRRTSQSLALHASASLALNRTGPALEDISTCLALTKVACADFTIVAPMMGVTSANSAIQCIWEGLVADRWNGQQLQQLQHALGGVDLLRPIRRGLLAERALTTYAFENGSRRKLSTNLVHGFNNSTWETRAQRSYIELAPRKWLDEIHISYIKARQADLDAIDCISQIIRPPKYQPAENTKRKISPFSAELKPDWSYSFDKGLRSIAATQTSLNQAMLACAIERYRLGHGTLPEKLETLVPQFIERLPHDIIIGEPLKYRRHSDGSFMLYSVGWNEKDENGIVADDYRSDGDWVWSSGIK
jgi:hypothetical protein